MLIALATALLRTMFMVSPNEGVGDAVWDGVARRKPQLSACVEVSGGRPPRPPEIVNTF